MEVIPPIFPIIISKCHYSAEYFVDIEHLFDSYCIPSKSSADKSSFFKKSAS